MNRVFLGLFFSICIFLASVSVALASDVRDVRDVRLWDAPDHTRVVFDLSRLVNYEVFRLHQPERVVIDLKNARMLKEPADLELSNSLVLALRSGIPQKGTLRIVLDVKENMGLRSFLLKPMHGKHYRLVVDLLRNEVKENQQNTKSVIKQKQHEIVIAVDAGHGGEDPGAIGRNGLQEKEVTLHVAKKLAELINKQPGMRAVLIRKGDYFVPLKKRVRLVREAQADMMISIHADAVKTRTVQGSSVYTLAERGATADKVAVALAAKENAADALGGVAPNDEVDDPMVRNILGDMAKRDSLNSSQILAESVLVQMKDVGTVKYDGPKRARFVVLSALEIPSVLVELDFISNPSQERKLKNSQHQGRLAKALYDASRNFFQRMGLLNSKTTPVTTS